MQGSQITSSSDRDLLAYRYIKSESAKRDKGASIALLTLPLGPIGQRGMRLPSTASVLKSSCSAVWLGLAQLTTPLFHPTLPIVCPKISPSHFSRTQEGCQ